MNKEVIYYDGRVVVVDEFGDRRPIVYSDNYDETLVQENVVESCENIIKALEKESYLYSNRKASDKIFAAFPFLAFTFGPPIILTLLNHETGYDNSQIINTTLGPMSTNELIIILSKFLIPAGGTMSLGIYASYIGDVKSEKGIQSSLEFLRNYLITQKHRLEELKKDTKVSDAEDGFKLYKVDDEEALNTLYRYRDLFYDLGYNFRRNYMYYMTRGELPKKLDKTYTDEEKEIAKKYLEEKGKTLSKRSK